ncbi:hypothetical protein LXA43DRAFT_1138997 [Ganoderma leucocontextum]|nr:hypothetical protein LXA43DRAFT_1138997 [Ganoderma leucocontextum]
MSSSLSSSCPLSCLVSPACICRVRSLHLAVGVLTVLSTMSTYFLFRNGPRCRAVILLLASTLMLYASTAAYWASIIANAFSANLLLEDAAGGLLDPSHSSRVARYHSRVLMQPIVATTSLAVNSRLGGIDGSSLLLMFIGKGSSTEVMRAFIILVESGTFYSVLWSRCTNQALSLKYPDNGFVVRFSFFVYGCLTPVIPEAIYPTSIIFLIALNRSHLQARLE